MTRLVFIPLALLIFTQSLIGNPVYGATAETETALADIQSALQARQFAEGVKQIDAALLTADEGRDYLLYLKGRALFYHKDFTAAVQACNQLLAAHPNSAWLRKAKFLQAECYLSRKAFDRAEAIYRAEVDRLLSSGRKSEIAQVYIRFAEAVSRQPDKNDLDAPPPNYQKAYNLYRKTLELEIDVGLKAEIMYRLGRMMQLGGNYPQAIHEYQTYLAEFDPDFHRLSKVGQDAILPLQRKETKNGGKHRYQARYHLAQCQIAESQHQSARLNLEDLLKMLDTSPTSEVDSQDLIKDARFLLTRTYHFPSPKTDEELQLGVQAAKRFLTDFTDDQRAMPLAYEIAQAYQARGRSEDALRAYQDFLDEAWDRLSSLGFDDTGESFAERHRRLRMSATFQIGEIRSAQGDYAGAIEAWQTYIREFPNGPQWTEAQGRIIDAEFQIGVMLLADEKYDEAARAFDAFQAAHPLDERVRQILFIYGQIHFHKADQWGKFSNLLEQTNSLLHAIGEWEKLVSKYPNTEESSLALFRIGEIYEDKLGDLDKALESYRKLTWGSWQGHAQARLRQMTEKHLKLLTQRTFRTNEPAQVHLSLRNIETLTVNLYQLNLEAYWRKIHGVKRVEDLDLALIAPDKMWEYRVPD